MAIDASKFTIDASGNIRQVSAFVPGTDTRFTTLELHAWLQDLADNPAPTGDDLVSILGSNPSELAGKRNASRPMALTLLPNYNIDDATSQWFKFGSIEQNTGNDLYTGLKVIGSLVASSPIYIYQNGAKVTKYWADADVNTGFQILMKAKAGGTLIDSGNVTVFSRKYGQTYSHFDANLAAGGEQAAALATSLDSNIALSASAAAAIWNTITVTVGDSTFDMGDGNGSKLYKGTIALNGTTTLAQAYQALMWACSESSTATINGVPGWRYRKLNAAYPENISAPFGTFAGGKFFVAQGWRLTGVMSADSKNYQLISDDGTIVIPPTSIIIEVTNTTNSDYVLVARDNGAGSINDTEYTVSASAGATSISVPGLKSDTPASGVIRIAGDRYTYTSWTGTTLNGLSPAIKSGGYSSKPAFIPFIDGTPSGSSIQSAAMQFGTNFTARFRVRNAGASPIVPFESTMSVTSNGGSGTAVRNPDA
jgi:hypothetical protein